MNKLIPLTLLILLVIPMIPAELIFKQNNPIQISHPIRLNGYPDPSILANLTVKDPENRIIAFQEMTFLSSTNEHNASLEAGNTSWLGQYEYCVSATDLTFNKTECFNYEVTITGDKPTTAQAMVYWTVGVLSIFLFILSLFGAIRIPFKNTRNERGHVISINDLKYVKLLLWFMTYLLLIFITFAFSNISDIANWDVASNYIGFLFYGLIGFLLPSFVLLVTFSVIIFFNDFQKKKLIERNLHIR